MVARHWWKWTLGVVLAVALGLGGWWVLSGRSRSEPAAAPDPSATHARDASQVATTLRTMPANPAAVVASSSRGSVTDARTALPAGTTVEPQPDTWAPDGLGGGTMTATVTAPGRPPVVYVVVMVHETSGWKVAATIPVSGS